MKIAIMQPYFLPYLGYFQLINYVDKFIIYDDVNYINRGWINRNNILINGNSHLITVPLNSSSQNKVIRDIHVLNENKWKEKMLKTITSNYSKAPFFLEVASMLEAILMNSYSNISELNFNALKEISAYLKINTEFVCTSSIYGNSHLNGQARIIDVCLKEKANYYINPINGKELYDKSIFQREGISINFIQMGNINYKQFNNSFVDFLSIVDVMMFNSVDVIMSKMINEFSLI
jgi:hypothetical protein